MMTPKKHARMLRTAEMSGRLDAASSRPQDAANAYRADRKPWWPLEMPAEYASAYEAGHADTTKLNQPGMG